jgi:hypothetical protein
MSYNIIIKKFPSANAFLEWATHAPCLWTGELSSRRTDRQHWYGTANYEEAYQLAKYGWPEGLAMLTKEVNAARKIIPQVVERKKRYDVAGQYPAPGRAAAGEAFAMVRKGQAFKQKPVLKVRLNINANAGVPANKIMQWGASICSYIDMIETQGQSVELTTIMESSSSGPNLSFQFLQKPAHHHLSMSSVVFWWANPSAQRRINFSGKERLDIERWYGDNYGCAENVTEPDEGTLHLSIYDAGQSLEENLEIMRAKHEAMERRTSRASSPAPAYG